MKRDMRVYIEDIFDLKNKMLKVRKDLEGNIS